MFHVIYNIFSVELKISKKKKKKTKKFLKKKDFEKKKQRKNRKNLKAIFPTLKKESSKTKRISKDIKEE